MRCSPRSCAAAVSRPAVGFLALGILAALIGLRLTAADAPQKKARVLIVTGIDYPGHLWRQTAPALADNLRKDPRLDVFTVEDPQFLDSPALTNYQAVVLHFQNWQVPGPAQPARDNLERFVREGGGLMSVHFACGAWHGEWPQFAEIVGRVWDPKLRGHDPYGKFRVNIVDADHPVSRGFPSFDTTDELYTCLTGRPPVRVLASANSVVDKQDYPMAFVKDYGRGRVFLTTLGHDITGITNSSVPELMRRGCAWAAGLTPSID